MSIIYYYYIIICKYTCIYIYIYFKNSDGNPITDENSLKRKPVCSMLSELYNTDPGSGLDSECVDSLTSSFTSPYRELITASEAATVPTSTSKYTVKLAKGNDESVIFRLFGQFLKNALIIIIVNL